MLPCLEMIDPIGFVITKIVECKERAEKGKQK
jgi:hypothetical protein